MRDWRGTTVIETKTYEALSELGIQYEREVAMREYVVDVFIPVLNLVIEVQGDFWHCNPEVYPGGPKTEYQRDNIIRDEQKLQYLIEHDYRILYLWEKDIHEVGAKTLIEDYLEVTAPSLEL